MMMFMTSPGQADPVRQLCERTVCCFGSPGPALFPPYLSHCQDVWMQSSMLMGVIHDINSFSKGTMTLCSDVIVACLRIQNKVSFLPYIIFVCDKIFVQAKFDLTVLIK